MKGLIPVNDLHEITNGGIFRLRHVSYISKLKKSNSSGRIRMGITIIVMMSKIDIVLASFPNGSADRLKQESDARDEYNRLIIAFKNTKSVI